MTDLKARRAKIKARSRQRRARLAPLVDGRPSGDGHARRVDDFRADLEELLGRPVIAIKATDLCNGDYAKAYRPRSLRADKALRRAFTRH
jgi:hypothetical protein